MSQDLIMNIDLGINKKHTNKFKDTKRKKRNLPTPATEGNEERKFSTHKKRKLNVQQGDKFESASREDNINLDISKKKPSYEKRSDAKSSEKSRKLAKFSSLFNKNPDIPTVECKQVVDVKEEVFSGDTFDCLAIHEHLVNNLSQKLKVTKMTSVQRATIPRILEGKDVLVKSQTGSGKTLAYAVPIAHDLQKREPHIKRNDGPYTIIIVPTRELVIQSFDVLQKILSTFVRIVPGSIMGGEKRKSEKARLRKGVNVLVSTPGRLLDHLENTHCLDLSHIDHLVIDEADRLLDLGFEKAVSQIINILNEKSYGRTRQTILLSATLSSGVELLAGISLRDPAKISISDAEAFSNVSSAGGCSGSDGQSEDVFSTPQSLKHHFVIVPNKLRLVTLAAFILWKTQHKGEPMKMIVFQPTQDSVEFHHTILKQILCDSSSDSQLSLFKLHGDMEQKLEIALAIPAFMTKNTIETIQQDKDRSAVFREFCEVDSGVLFCTDVAARGLDLPSVRWIVQHSASNVTDYIHRVGRTARIGTQGNALLFLSPSEVEYVQIITKSNISMTELSINDILKTLLMPKNHTLVDVVKTQRKTAEQAATDLQILFEEQVQENTDLGLLARSAYQSFVRAYATYPTQLKHIFHVKHLHLGHVAKSFALQDSPSNVGDFISKSGYGGKKKFDKPGSRQKRVSEFGSGLGNAAVMAKISSKTKKGRHTKKPVTRKK